LAIIKAVYLSQPYHLPVKYNFAACCLVNRVSVEGLLEK